MARKDDEGKLELSVRILGNEIIGFKMVVDDFKMKWNLTEDGSTWIIREESVNQIGCIHTCQGLEVDYIGVIVGNDLIIRNGKVFTDVSKRASSDKSIHGYKRMMESNKLETQEFLDLIIKNTYRTLMTRGMKGCYVYFVDKETREYFKQVITKY